ncbi:sensor histidine kinase [Cellulomonas carbonis]|uniref:Sensor-like histidine kinase SenX3 n=1 Tax=Cellulomonas carbonis T26 TaxID=947969 RepID=A0A0A0BRR3_9CELL|nr:ATP-binding protein [Cellulomonas carbonis]KGM11153.1 histidine kinase [Cellulomonas carbonis T26]GGC05087.1 two-component sensor histidine kinase [Cellulomonas carbonis]
MTDGLPTDGVTLGAMLLVAALVGLVVGVLVARRARGVRDAGVHDTTGGALGGGQHHAVPDGVGAVLDALRAGAVVATRSGRVVRANAPATRLGLVRGDRIVNPAVERLVLDAAQDGRQVDEEVEVQRSAVGGATLVLHVRVAVLDAEHVLLIVEDRTDALRLEAVRRDFVVNTSHELKTPVGALSLLAETVEDAADDPETVRRFAGRMRTEAQRLAALVQEIIELSRLQSTDPSREPEHVLVADVVGEAVERSRTAAGARRIAIEAGPVPDAVVLGSHDLLVTAVRNLLDNAVAYSEPGTRVAVGTSVDVAAGTVEVAVVDQGIGIPAEAVPRLFERFYRVDPARSRDTGGTGLGLSIVKHVVADHGGEVSVWSQPGQGSTFTVRLPLADASATEGADR